MTETPLDKNRNMHYACIDKEILVQRTERLPLTKTYMPKLKLMEGGNSMVDSLSPAYVVGGEVTVTPILASGPWILLFAAVAIAIAVPLLTKRISIKLVRS